MGAPSRSRIETRSHFGQQARYWRPNSALCEAPFSHRRWDTRRESFVCASLASFSSRSHRHDFIAQFARDLFAISGSNFRDRKRALRADFAFEKKIKEMRQQCHVTPVADLIGNRTV